MSKHPAQILKRPLLTEKGTKLAEDHNQILFEVATNANKVEIRRAVEKVYDVKVEHVNTQIVRGKLKRMGRHVGRRTNWKKAVVKLAAGSSIDFFSAS